VPVCDVSCNVSLPSYVILGLRKYFFLFLCYMYSFMKLKRVIVTQTCQLLFWHGALAAIQVWGRKNSDASLATTGWGGCKPLHKNCFNFFVSKWHASTQSGIALNTVYMTAVCMQQKSLKPFCICEDNLLEFSENCVVGSTLCLALLGLQFKVQSVY